MSCDIAQNFDNGKLALGVFINLKKLKHGVNEKTLAWLRNYLFKRKQYTKNNNDIKNLLEIDSSVTQGPTLGPLLFLIYVNYFHFPSTLMFTSCLLLT